MVTFFSYLILSCEFQKQLPVYGWRLYVLDVYRQNYVFNQFYVQDP